MVGSSLICVRASAGRRLRGYKDDWRERKGAVGGTPRSVEPTRVVADQRLLAARRDTFPSSRHLAIPAHLVEQRALLLAVFPGLRSQRLEARVAT